MKTTVPACLLALFVALPGCVSEVENPNATTPNKDAAGSAKKSTTSKPTTSKPTDKGKAAAAKAAFVDIQSAEVKALLDKDKSIVILDIRTPKEFNAGHIEGAKHIDFFAKDFNKKIAELDKSTHYLVHCASGGRSGKSMQQFKDLGFLKITHLADGYKGWVAADLPVVK